MKKNIIILLIAIIILGLAAVFFVWTLNSDKEEEIIPENTAVIEEVSKTKDLGDLDYIDFTFYREDGSEVMLSDYKDKATMVLFWNPEVEDSVSVLKKVNEMYENYSSEINFLMINTAQEVNEEIKQEVSMEIFYDFYREGMIKYRIPEVPAMLYITKENEIFNAKTGFTTTDALEANLDIISNNY